MPEINGVSVPFIPAGGATELTRQQNKLNIGSSSSSKFSEIFEQELTKVKFSGHAQSRIVSRDIEINTADMLRLETAVDRAAEKGANESLVIMDDKAFIVSVPNKTVITMINRNQMDENIVTNIDSAVFA